MRLDYVERYIPKVGTALGRIFSDRRSEEAGKDFRATDYKRAAQQHQHNRHRSGAAYYGRANAPRTLLIFLATPTEITNDQHEEDFGAEADDAAARIRRNQRHRHDDNCECVEWPLVTFERAADQETEGYRQNEFHV